jgi:hypothetical protein
MRRFDEIGDTSFGGLSGAESYTAPNAPAQSYLDYSDQVFDPFPLPFVSNPALGTGLQLGSGQSYTPGVSRVGPTASDLPRAAMDPNVRAGSLFSGGFPTQANFRAGRGYMAQRAGFFAQIQERLRRRRRGLSR